jgi:hypothetical protein
VVSVAYFIVMLGVGAMLAGCGLSLMNFDASSSRSWIGLSILYTGTGIVSGLLLILVENYV